MVDDFVEVIHKAFDFQKVYYSNIWEGNNEDENVLFEGENELLYLHFGHVD